MSNEARSHERTQILMFYAMTHGAYTLMTEEQKAELHAWEAEHVTGSGDYGTSDWPGWQRLGLPPKPDFGPMPRPAAKATIPKRVRTAVMERDGYRCQGRACGTHLDLTIDHVYPESRGGPATLDNLQTLCRSCNARKGATVVVQP